jgi:hypothetical protein
MIRQLQPRIEETRVEHFPSHFSSCDFSFFLFVCAVTAVAFYREQKEMMTHLEKVVKAKQLSGIPPPRYSYENASYSEELSFLHLADTMLEIEIVGCETLRPPQGQDSVDPYLVLIFPYPSELPQRIDTQKVSKSINPGMYSSSLLDSIPFFCLHPSRSF